MWFNVIGIFNWLIEKLASVIGVFLNLLPNSPFQWSSLDSGWLGAINWIFPISSAIAHLEFYVAAVSIYYGLRLVLRWAKAAGG